MRNPFKQAIKNLIDDLENYNYLLGDLELYEFGKNNSTSYINNLQFIEKFPLTHKFILLEHIIYYIGFIEGSYVIDDFEYWKNNSFDIEINKYLSSNVSIRDDFFYILKGYREAFYEKLLKGINSPESRELINASNGLIPILKFLYKNSDEFL